MGQVSYIRCDTTEDSSDHIRKGDKILHLAAIARSNSAERDLKLALNVNVLGTLNVI